jgi:prepilin-type N-terminal cleavage/methylation domain-containing protein
MGSSVEFFRGAPVRRAFTIVELLVVISIIGVLVAMLLPAVNGVRIAAQRTQNANNLSQIGKAILIYEQAKKTYPALSEYYGPKTSTGTASNPSSTTIDDEMTVSWAFSILPYLEQQNLYDRLVRTKKTTEIENAVAMGTPVEIYANPSRRDASATSPFRKLQQEARGATLDYAANGGIIVDKVRNRVADPLILPSDPKRVKLDFPYRDKPFDPRFSGPFHPDRAVPSAVVKDGLTNTLCVGDRWIGPPVPGNEGVWNDLAGYAGDSFATTIRYANPNDGPIPSIFPIGLDDPSILKFGNPRVGDACFVFLDGRVLWLPYDIDPRVFQNLACINDGNPVPPLN